MRVIAGTYRRRLLKSVPGFDVRPTPDRLREALFNILAPRIGGAAFIDAYAGTGAVGIEALSRGARQVTFVERDPMALACLRQNLASLQIGSEAVVLKGSAARLLKERGADIVFLDPPYERRNEYSEALAALGAERSKLVIAQHETRFDPGDGTGVWRRMRVVKHGSNALSFYEPVASDSVAS
jgi:16S rRNA (guanine(966)-N(2))-methyltransferase RsmD